MDATPHSRALSKAGYDDDSISAYLDVVVIIAPKAQDPTHIRPWGPLRRQKITPSRCHTTVVCMETSFEGLADSGENQDVLRIWLSLST